jgi:hypothetical protein
MPIWIDPVITHDTEPSGGNNTVPPGISGQDWAHLVSATTDEGTGSLLELEAFLTANILTIGQPSTNIRTPLPLGLGSLITYAGLDATMYAAAVAAGAHEGNKRFVVAHAFDSNGGSVYEPGWT